jgi:hypothetical protein
MMSIETFREKIKHEEPLVSLYRARETIRNPAHLDLLDSLIYLVTKEKLKSWKQDSDVGHRQP